jgi:hypothetical protein
MYNGKEYHQCQTVRYTKFTQILDIVISVYYTGRLTHKIENMIKEMFDIGLFLRLFTAKRIKRFHWFYLIPVYMFCIKMIKSTNKNGQMV